VPYPLLTHRLSIEPLAMDDLDSFVSYRQDPEIARFQSWEPSYSRAQAIDLIESQKGVVLPEKGQWLQLAIHNRVSGEHLGDLALHRMEDTDSSYEIGFTIARKHQGNGFAKEAAHELMDYLSLQGATNFIATTDRRNTSSIKVLTGLGFEKQPAKSWSEEFKNEFVAVDYYERT
jgi:RimJ/RimL family protein N-acetyltransferase